ncbi:MAG TPA: phenylalanine--tRNA ligase subunit beta [Acidimicrobiales bacterium]|nr:phenylalanine--tRNA ligase subunit beta [Acidimicrobiales bacterium]
MRAPLSWLRDYAALDADPSDLAIALSELGLVVEGVERVGAGLEDVVVAKVLDIRIHADADRIRLVDVDAGDGNPLQIVCGAWNFEVGDLVPLAPVGAGLPGGFEIKRRKMRGEWSNGMLCSPPELELPQESGSADGLMILPAGLAAPGTPLVEALDLHPDVVFDLDISANRPDALCMAGVARDLAARLGEPWSLPETPAPPPVDDSVGTAPITVESGDLCPRFTGTVLEGVPRGPSPAWIARRLTLAGMRPINAVVDVSNYVMLDLGQPNHAYDLQRLGGHGILVRRARPGEVLRTLDGEERTLQQDDCVICDAQGTPVGVGGIMGGADAEIAKDTTRVLLEAAWFSPMAIARTGSRLGLHSEARVRFERGVDPQIAFHAVDRFVALLSAIPGGSGVRRGPTVDVVDHRSLPRQRTVTVRTERTNQILGTELTAQDIARLTEPIGFEVSVKEKGAVDAAPDPAVLDVVVPSWRLDTEREIDVIEEVARMWGYSKIRRTVPAGTSGHAGGLTSYQKQRRRVRDILVGAGYDEAWTTTFLAPGDLERAGRDPAAVEVENPLDRSESILRTSLLPGLLKAVRFNRDRQAGDVCLFEIGNVFALPPPDRVTPTETEMLGVIVAPATAGSDGDSRPAVASARTWRLLADALRLEGPRVHADTPAGWHPARAARITGVKGLALGTLGEVEPAVVNAYGLTGRIGFLEVSLEALSEEPRRPLESRPVSRFPAGDVDLAFVLDETVPAGEVTETITRAGGDLLESCWLFDVYRSDQIGAQRKSLAFRLRFRAPDRTLDDAELARLRQTAIDAVTKEHGAALRS